MRNLLRSNSKMFLTICILSSFVIGLSYAAFKVNSTSYKATNMMVSKLMYGISIQEINKSTSTINGNVVTIPANTKSYFYVTISSINKINSKYSLAYKSSNSVVVKYSDKSEYTPTEEIEGFTTTNTYSKVVKISIDNTSNDTNTEVTINAFGGYTHNDYTTIILDSGYLSITNTYEEGGDINFVSYTVDGNTTELSYEELVENNKVNSVTCENGSVAEWDSENKSIFFSTLNVPDYCIVDFSTEGLTPQFIDKILADNSTVSERTDFSVINVENTTGTIYKTNKTEDGTDVYYYSGNTTNNWVYFGGFYWRIIRTNEDGSVRMLYTGTSHDTTAGYISRNLAFNSDYNETYNYSKYVGYMYGGTSSLADNRANTTSSTIKTYIDTWYQNNLLNNYDKYISKSAIYCNDRSVGSGTWRNVTSTTSNSFSYGGSTRVSSNKSPNYKCGANVENGLFETTQAIEDKFSASTIGGGNGQLAYPIALMTADEVVFAGGKMNTWLSKPYSWFILNSVDGLATYGQIWWLLTPSNSFTGYLKIFTLDEMDVGCLSTSYPNNSYAVRPVISISSCAKVTGTGTPTDPYIIDETNSTC